MLAGRESIRDVIAFPKTASGTDPLTGAPAPLDAGAAAGAGNPGGSARAAIGLLRFPAAMPILQQRLLTSRRPELVRQSLSV